MRVCVDLGFRQDPPATLVTVSFQKYRSVRELVMETQDGLESTKRHGKNGIHAAFLEGCATHSANRTFTPSLIHNPPHAFPTHASGQSMIPACSQLV